MNDDFKAQYEQGMIARQQLVMDQHQRASKLLSGGFGQRVGDVVSLGPHDEDNYIAEIISNARGEVMWSVVVDGKTTSELFSSKGEALVRWVDVTNNGRTSQAHQWAVKLLTP